MRNISKILLGGSLGVFLLILGVILYVGSLMGSGNHSNQFFNRIEGNGIIAEEIRNTQPFDKIEVSSGLHVHIRQEPSHAVKVVTDENVLEFIVTDVKNGTLRIYTDEKLRNLRKRDVYVSIDTLKGLQIKAGAKATSENDLSGNYIDIHGSSGSQSGLGLYYESVNVEISSGAHLNIGGEARQGKFGGSSGAHLNAGELRVDKAHANVSSGAHLNLGEIQKLSVHASSGGHVNYKGNPEIENANLSSGGQMSRR